MRVSLRLVDFLIALPAAMGGCAYNGGSFTYGLSPFVGDRATVGCLDVAVVRRADLPAGGAALGYMFGNRCDHPMPLDLLSVNVIGRTADGREVELLPFDPGHDIRPLSIDGRTSGEEAIAYHNSAALTEVCVDVASIVHERPARWICMSSNAPEPVPQPTTASATTEAS